MQEAEAEDSEDIFPNLNAILEMGTCSPESSFVLLQLHLVQCCPLYGVDETHQRGPLPGSSFGCTKNGFREILVEEGSGHLSSQFSFVFTSSLHHLLRRQ
ncbi:hypothetical protein EYF80_018637 [Liparis tanakae]|uniref:Uncharacterized protein n=1 Tax=Liparis tanakae TaxID=230148 RepID=A0A4Z2HZF6_9TELE|nr:hypothetical protein EYF80_018637 [Liparis tanakae]